MKKRLAENVLAANRTLFADAEFSTIGDIFSEDYVVHVTGRDLTGGPNLVHDIITSLRKSFDDIHVAVDILLQFENRIAWQRTLRGKHSKKFKGFPATGQEMQWRDMVVSEFRDGLIAEEWIVTDLAEQLLRAKKSR